MMSGSGTAPGPFICSRNWTMNFRSILNLNWTLLIVGCDNKIKRSCTYSPNGQFSSQRSGKLWYILIRLYYEIGSNWPAMEVNFLQAKGMHDWIARCSVIIGLGIHPCFAPHQCTAHSLSFHVPCTQLHTPLSGQWCGCGCGCGVYTYNTSLVFYVAQN